MQAQIASLYEDGLYEDDVAPEAEDNSAMMESTSTAVDNPDDDQTDINLLNTELNPDYSQAYGKDVDTIQSGN